MSESTHSFSQYGSPIRKRQEASLEAPELSEEEKRERNKQPELVETAKHRHESDVPQTYAAERELSGENVNVPAEEGGDQSIMTQDPSGKLRETTASGSSSLLGKLVGTFEEKVGSLLGNEKLRQVGEIKRTEAEIAEHAQEGRR